MPRFAAITGTATAALLGTISMPTPLAAQGVDFPTTCSREADAAVDAGLTFLHNMMYIQAEAAFGRAAEVDSDCAMAQWGILLRSFLSCRAAARDLFQGVMVARRVFRDHGWHACCDRARGARGVQEPRPN